MKIVYIAETSLTNKSAYTHHVLKMCDAFSKKGEVELILPYIKENTILKSIKKNFLLSIKKIILKGMLRNKIKNFLSKSVLAINLRNILRTLILRLLLQEV